MKYIAFDIGGTKIKYSIIDKNYNIIKKNQIDTNAKLGGVHVINKVIDIINDYKNKFELNSVAISTAGVVDPTTGIILYANDVMPEYTGLNLPKMIYEKTTLLATVENDVNCFALSHLLSIDTDYLMVAVGTGIGGSIVINKQIYHGITKSGGEFGNMIIDKGKRFEDLASITALVRYANELGLNVHNGLDVFNLYDQKDEKATKAVNYFYKYLALGLLNLAYIFNIPKIILGGGITNRPTFLTELMEKIKLYENKPYNNTEIIVSKNTNDGGMLGALVHHLNIRK
ncbi:MAG TPA: ROK family protein [Acholeplasmataceae bacterium]|nr:ROK family protein [Acholeplasmataceae bacterium]